jgi:hypothetical protein
MIELIAVAAIIALLSLLALAWRMDPKVPSQWDAIREAFDRLDRLGRGNGCDG